MRISLPAAGIAAFFTFGAAMLGATTPGAAQDAPPPVAQAAPAAPVPTPPPPIVPAGITPEGPAAIDVAAATTTGPFPSLAAAVAAQAQGLDIEEETRCLATGIYFESKGEPLAGQLAVAEVIINRSRSGRFPGSVCAVLTQRGQFSFVRGGRLPSVPTGSQAWRTAVAVARVAEEQLWDSPVDGALFFHARYVSPRWRLARVGSVGNHIFYR